MKKYYIYTLLLASVMSVASVQAQAQSDSVELLKLPEGLFKRELDITLQQWKKTSNAAGMSFDRVAMGSLSTIGVHTESGDHHRAQEGSQIRGFAFETERYDKFNDKLLVNGYFKFDMTREYERSWSDVLHTYNSNPMIFGSNVKSKYDNQSFTLGAKIYSALGQGFNYGLGVEYITTDVSRQRDPRTRTFDLEYRITPGVTYSFGDNHHILGFDANYHFEKEKMPSITTVQEDPNLKYYIFNGVEIVDGKIGAYKAFYRQYTTNEGGFSLQYNYRNDAFRFLISGGMDILNQELIGSKREIYGKYDAYTYRGRMNAQIIGRSAIHDITLSAKMVDGGADDYHQELISSIDPDTGSTSENWATIYIYKNRAMVKTTDVELAWRMLSGLTNTADGYKWALGAKAAYSSFENRHYMPESLYKADRVFFGVNGSYALMDTKKGKLMLNGAVVGSYNMNSELSTTLQTEVLTNVLTPDLAYHQQRTVDVKADLQYTRPIQLTKKSKAYLYAKAYFGNIMAPSAHWTSGGITIGLLTL